MKKLTYEYVKSLIENEKGYKVISGEEDYVHTKSIINVICPNGENWKTNYNRFQQGQRCSCLKCGGHRPLTYEYVKGYIESQGEVLISEKYINNRAPLIVRCRHGHEYYPTFNHFKDSGSRCPICNESKGEKQLIRIFESYSIGFIRQYKSHNCKDKRVLPFDFYLPDYNILIEYDGKQHYEEGCFGMDKKSFRQIKRRDKIKNNYAKQNQIKLIRIPYWDYDNIENILIKELNLQ